MNKLTTTLSRLNRRGPRTVQIVVSVLVMLALIVPVAYAADDVADNFSTGGYTGNSGSVNWTTSWTEANDSGAGPTSGVIQVVSNELRFNDYNNTGQPSLRRQADLSSADWATLSFQYGSSGNLENSSNETDKLDFQISLDGGSTWEIVSTLAGDVAGAPAARAPVSVSIPSYMAGNTLLRMWVVDRPITLNSLTGSTEYYYIDDVQIEYGNFPAVVAAPPGPPVVQTYYIPVPEDHVLNSLGTIYTAEGTCTGGAEPSDAVQTYVSVSVLYAGTIIYYDHWEDDFEADIRVRTQASTQIWGDSDTSNGFPPGYPADSLSANDVIILENAVSSTRLSAVDVDGGDKVAASRPIAMSRGAWAARTGTLFAGATEILDTGFWGTAFESPVGESLLTPHNTTNQGANDFFEYTGFSVMAKEDNTQVTIDADGPGGSGAVVVNLNEGGAYQTNGGVEVGGTVSADKPVQVNLLTGDICSTYSSRWYALYPDDLLSDDYYSPVGTPYLPGNDESDATYVWLHNPGTSTISVQWETASGSQTAVSLTANETKSVTIPYPSSVPQGSHFYTTNGAKFSAIATIDSDGDRRTTHDWGYALPPDVALSSQLLVGWGAGEDPTLSTGENGGPVWITPACPTGTANTYVYVDFDNDGTPDLADLDGDGLTNGTVNGISESSSNLGMLTPRLQSVRIFNPSVNDQTGAFVYTRVNSGDTGPPGCNIAGAWGQDPLTSSPAAPAIDLGTGIPNLASWLTAKDAVLKTDGNNNGLYDVGDTVTFEIEIFNASVTAIPGGTITVVDDAPPDTEYVASSTYFDNGTTPVLITDDPDIPLNGSGYTIPSALPAGATFVVRYDVVIETYPPEGTITNVARVYDSTTEFFPEVTIEVRKPAAIGNYVWLDENSDGYQDAGEAGIPNVRVELNGTDENGNTVNLDTWTDAHGGYLFDGLTAGTYTVTVDQSTLPTGLNNWTGPHAGQIAGADFGNQDPTGYSVTVSDGDENLSADFGYNWNPSADVNDPAGDPPGVIGDRVWVDGDGDGVQDPEEIGLAGVTVRLLDDPDGDGIYTPAGSAVTDDNGNYIFDNLPPGGYIVRVDPSTLPAGYFQSGDPDEFGATCTACDNQTTDPIILAPGDVFLNADFGYRPEVLLNSIGDRVWLDADGDGVGTDGNGAAPGDDSAEPGIPGVAVQLTWYGADGAPGGGDDVVYTTVTDENGDYLFDGLPDGNFQVTTNLGSNFAPGGPLAGLNQTYDATAPLDHTSTVSAAGGANIRNQDFGYWPSSGNPPDGAIGDTVFFDTDGNGQPGAGEGIPGVRVELWTDLDGNPNTNDGALVGFDYTDGSGLYYFGDLNPAGTYRVMVDPAGNTLPAGVTNSVDPDGVAPPSVSVVNLALDPDGVFDGINLDQDFGYTAANNPLHNAIGDKVWLDANGNQVGPNGNGAAPGTDNGEPGLPGVLVQLTWAGPDGNPGTTVDNVVYYAVTDENGDYLFDGLPDGNYQVTTNLPSNFATGGPLAGLNQTYDATAPLDHTSTVNGLSGGTTVLTQDFGYWPSDGNAPNGVIGDTVFFDADGDGQPDGGEGIPGVRVDLYIDPDGDPNTGGGTFVGTAFTDANGLYYFGDLDPTLAYRVEVDPGGGTLPAGLINTVDPDGVAPQNVSVVDLAADPDGVNDGINLDQDFGYQRVDAHVGSIGDYVWLDADADGVGPNGNGGSPGNDNGEYGIPGVTVALIKDVGVIGTYEPGVDEIIATDMTDSTGYYLFTGLPANGTEDYLVLVNDTDNVLSELAPTYDQDGAAGGGGANQADSVLGLSSVQNLTRAGNFAQDFGYTAIGHDTGEGLIGDTIFHDLNPGDGNVFNPGVDQPLEGVVVELLDNGGAVIATTTTDENGRYYFGNLAVSAGGVPYTVRVVPATLPPGMTSNTVDPDGGADGQSTVNLMTSQPINLDQDFGYRSAEGSGSIGDEIWLDVDADGVKDPGEVGIDGVTVDLYSDTNGNGSVDPGEPRIGSTTTSGGGMYLFSDLPAGDYVVDVTDTAGVLSGYWHSLHPTNPAGTTDKQSKYDPHGVTLTAGQNYVAADFGYYVEPAALGNRVWNDINGNGIQEAGEPGIPGVEVKLTISYPGNTPITVVAITDANGYYRFGNLLLDEDYNGDSGTPPEPTYSISVNPGQSALAGYSFPSPIHTPAGAPYRDSDNQAGEPAFPVQGQTDTSAAADGTTPASYDFGFSSNPTGVDGVVVGTFTAAWQGEMIVVHWATVSELDVQGFDLYRAATEGGAQTKINDALIPVQTPGSPMGASYQFEDKTAQEGMTYFYWLHGIDLRGQTTPYGPVMVAAHRALLPLVFKNQ